MLKMLKQLLCVFVLFPFGDCIECPVNFVPVYDGCFLAANYLTTPRAGAEQFCSMNGGYLARIKSCTLLGDLVRYFHFYDLEANGYWIGATDEDSENDWLWTDGDPVPLGAPFWGFNSMSGSGWVNEPNGGAIENCAILSGLDRYRFHDENCGSSFAVLCQVDPLPGDISEDNVDHGDVYDDMENYHNIPDDDLDDDKASSCANDFVLISGSCFYFGYNHRVDWYDAYDICRNQYDSHLAILDSCELLQEVAAEIINNATYDLAKDALYWLGGSDNNQEGHWYWTNLEPMAMGPPFWGVAGDGRLEPSGKENQNCANIYKNDQYYFHDTQCDLGGYALCQRDPE